MHIEGSILTGSPTRDQHRQNAPGQPAKRGRKPRSKRPLPSTQEGTKTDPTTLPAAHHAYPETGADADQEADVEHVTTDGQQEGSSAQLAPGNSIMESEQPFSPAEHVPAGAKQGGADAAYPASDPVPPPSPAERHATASDTAKTLPVAEPAPPATTSSSAPMDAPSQNSPLPSLSASSSETSLREARRKLFGKRTSLTYPALPSLLEQKKTAANTSRHPGLKRTTRIPPLHAKRQPPPPPKPRYVPPPKPKDEALGSDEEAEPEPEIDYENEGFL